MSGRNVSPEVEFSKLLTKGIEYVIYKDVIALRFSVQLKRSEWQMLCELSEALNKDVEMVLRNIVKSEIQKWYDEICKKDETVKSEDEPKDAVKDVTEDDIINVVLQNEGITVEGLIRKIKPANKYKVCKTLESLAKEGKIRYGEVTDPYRPYWSQKIYLSK